MKNLTVFILFLFIGLELLAQSPHSFRYQAVARDNSGNLLSNQAVSFKINILSGGVSGTTMYSEVHSGINTNNFGLVGLEIGKGTPETGTFSSINWSNSSYYVKVEMDPAGGSAYQLLSTSQLLSVPFALHANTVETGDNWGNENVNSDATLLGNGTNSSPLKLAQQSAATGQVLKWNGNTWLPGSDLSGSSLWSQNEPNIYYSSGYMGLGTSTPSTYIHAHGSPISARGQLSLSAPSGEGVFLSFYDADVFKAYLWYDVSEEDLRIQNFTAGDLNLNPYGGNVGIGTNEPGAALDVAGQIKITGGTPGVGKVLTSDETGLSTWETPKEGGSGDISAVNAGTGLDGGGSEGDVTLEVEVPLQLTSSTNEVIKGTHNSGNSGYLGSEDYGVYGKFNNGPSGQIGTVSHGVVGEYPNRSYGYLGGFSNSVWGQHSSGNYGRIGHATVGVEGGYGNNGPSGSLGTFQSGVVGSKGVSGVYAGDFYGDVRVSGHISKTSGTFKIDHPLDPANKYLQHSFVESPDMMNIYSGIVILNKYGETIIEMPDWFEALNKEFCYQLTCIGGFANIYISEEIHNNKFKIAGGTSGLKVSWQVTGIRKDAYAEMNRILVEEPKEGDEAGKYIHPEAFGLPEEMGIGYEERKSMEEANNIVTKE